MRLAPSGSATKLVEILEGSTRLIVPGASVDNPSPPRTPIFFNQAASINRDVSVVIAEAVGGATFCDSMAGAGARGLRVAKEARTSKEVTLVDINERSVDAARRSAHLNGIQDKCEFKVGDASSVLASRYGRDMKFEMVDLDPFGSPVRHLCAAVSAVKDGGVLSVTATDTAVLCGVYPATARRRYGAVPMNNGFHHETAVRILLNSVRKAAGPLDIGISPVAAHATRHYLRVYVKLEHGAARADSSLKKEGYLVSCPHCGEVSASASITSSCDSCGRKARFAGPLWLGPLSDPSTLRRSASLAEERKYVEATRILSSLGGIDGFPPWSYSIEDSCSKLGVASVSEGKVMAFLSGLGYRAVRQPFETRGLKTTAPVRAIEDAVRSLSRT